mmetsp:Transcript_15387/g.47633  ORF Transcript_15387/g.47633 Transcript_15387/m.47633 type:complete len:171 (+) Transcript_15387:176-688(+)
MSRGGHGAAGTDILEFIRQPTTQAVDNERRCVDDARRNVDEKAEQLKAVSHLSALIAGFAMVVMVEIQLPDKINFGLLIVYGTTSASVVGLMLLAMLNCTMMLIAILKYDSISRPIPYYTFWQTRSSPHIRMYRHESRVSGVRVIGVLPIDASPWGSQCSWWCLHRPVNV